MKILDMETGKEVTTTPEEFMKDPLFESYAWRTGFRELRPDEKLQAGDVLLMSILDSTLNHVAIFLGDEVLHHLTEDYLVENHILLGY